MSLKNRDSLTGHKTTGHEWDGIVELNTPVPRLIWGFIIVTHVWAFVMWIFLPAWPLLFNYTHGVLGLDQRDEVEVKLVEAKAQRAVWTDRIDMLEPEAIMADPELSRNVRLTGNQLFGDNCAVCHGLDAKGGPGFPSLVDSAWLWGSEYEDILETIRVGINSPHDETRIAEMMAFGRDGILSRDEVRVVADYVLSLSGKTVAPARLEQGAEIFADNCASCHNDDGTGNIYMGAPDLTDDFWIYGGSDKQLFATIYGGRAGLMPAWEGRLSDTDIKILTLYVQDRGIATEEAAQ